jgi:oxygen-independent coproporphyrinogen-3 oxidase
MAHLEADLDTAARLQPEHVAVYALSVEEGTPFHRMAEAGELPLPDEETALRMLEETESCLSRAGFERYEISNYALPGRRSRHNQVYWRRQSYLGFGAGAHSFLSIPGFGCRWRNPDTLEGYMGLSGECLLEGVDRAELSKREAMGEWLFLGLRMLEGVCPGDFLTLFGVALEDAYGEEMARLEGAGLLLRTDGRVRLSPRGLLFYNRVVANFI